MSRYLLVVLLLVAMVAGCADRSEAPASVAGVASGERKASEANRFLAYEHSIYLQAAGDKVLPIFEAAQAACRDAVEESCAILEARVSSGDAASASLRFRAKAGGIRKLIAILSAQGEVASQSTTAEDLAGPIADTTKQIAMLTDYRTSLEALRSRPSNDLDALMRLTRELADVQSQLETLSGSQAALTQRVQTELLNVSINSGHSSSFFGTIADSAGSFSDVLSEGIGAAIIAFAYLLPWAVFIGGIAWIALAIRRWRKRQRVQS
jgi:uncharacterized protein DUF4349